MSLDMRDKAAVQKRLWDDIEASRFGMLGAHGEPMQLTPMTAFGERESGKIWFFTSKESELAKASRLGVAASFVIITKDQKLQACVRGELLATDQDALHVDKYWSPVVAAWFPKGKEDPNLTMLCLTCSDADVWVSEKGPLGFGWEIAKANMGGGQPDVGGHAALVLA
jgi:general stress protein 26